jgi:hypothetical protein
MTLFFRAVLLLSLALNETSVEAHGKATKTLFPMSVGTYWTYKGFVRWTRENSSEVSQTRVVWKTQISGHVEQGQYSAAIVNGFPSDLDWSNGRPEPSNTLLVQVGVSDVYVVEPDRVPESWWRLQGSNDSLQRLLSLHDLFVRFPLLKGKKLCDEGETARTDFRYCWFVESVDRSSLGNVRGVRRGIHTVYRLRYVTLPDDTTVDFAPGVGIIRYSYHHHGSVADTELRLIEFHQVSPSSAR